MKFVRKVEKQDMVRLQEMMKSNSSFKVRKRAHAILLSSKNFKIEELATIFDADRDTISEWLKRWEDYGVEGLFDAPRSGRPRKSADLPPAHRQ